MMISPLLIIGLVAFILIHLIPVYADDFRDRLMNRMGPKVYRGFFGTLSIVFLIMIVMGWQNSAPYFLYDLGDWLYSVVPPVVMMGFILLLAAFMPTNFNRVVRNPRMIGIFLWASAHVLINGDSRSILLFGGIIIWCVIAYHGALKRDGKWQKPARVPMYWDGLAIVAGILMSTGIIFLHEKVIGVNPMPVL